MFVVTIHRTDLLLSENMDIFAQLVAEYLATSGKPDRHVDQITELVAFPSANGSRGT